MGGLVYALWRVFHLRLSQLQDFLIHSIRLLWFWKGIWFDLQCKQSSLGFSATLPSSLEVATTGIALVAHLGSIHERHHSKIRRIAPNGSCDCDGFLY